MVGEILGRMGNMTQILNSRVGIMGGESGCSGLTCVGEGETGGLILKLFPTDGHLQIPSIHSFVPQTSYVPTVCAESSGCGLAVSASPAAC